jgi:hypothetical protein
MPITRFLQGFICDPETKRVMGVAYEMTLVSLRLADRDDLATESVAKKIIELAQAGERDPDRLCERALGALAANSASPPQAGAPSTD